MPGMRQQQQQRQEMETPKKAICPHPQAPVRDARWPSRASRE